MSGDGDRCALNTDPPESRCRSCRRPLRRDSHGYWWSCNDSAHGSSHHPARTGICWRLLGWRNALLLALPPWRGQEPQR